jgi:hypothetical protein
LVWQYKKSIKSVHEYLADAAVLREVTTPIYGRLLLSQVASTSTQQPILINHFIFSKLKKRIVMMTKNRSNQTAILKYGLAVPLFFVLALVCSVKNQGLAANVVQRPTTALVAVDTEVVYEKVDELPHYIGGEAAMMKFLAENIKYPADARENQVHGIIYLSFVIGSDGVIRDVFSKKDIVVIDTVQIIDDAGKAIGKPKIITNTNTSCGKEGVRVIKLMPRWVPGKKDGKNVPCRFILPIKFKLE